MSDKLTVGRIEFGWTNPAPDAAAPQIAGAGSLGWISPEQASALNARIATLEQQLAEEHKDAGRYRRLRSMHDSHKTKWHVRNRYGCIIGAGKLDAEIDATQEGEN